MILIRSSLLLLLALMPVWSLATESSANRAPILTDRKPTAVNFSARYKSLSTERAYQLQKAFVRNRVAHGVTMVGFKAGMTTPETQAIFGINSPITGVLIEPPLQGSNIILSLDQAHDLRVEQEIAFRVSEVISSKVDDVESLKDYFDAIAPAVELPDLNFIASEFNGLDVIANNAMAYKLIIGQWRESSRDLDTVPTTLYCDERLLINQSSSKVLEGQWDALLWMVNHVISQGYTIQPGHILLTGAINGMHKATACHYTADFGALGVIRFIVR